MSSTTTDEPTVICADCRRPATTEAGVRVCRSCDAELGADGDVVGYGLHTAEADDAE